MTGQLTLKPAKPGVRGVQKATTRAKIVEAARDLFAERGYHAATVRDIAARAGVSPGSLFTSFTGKAQLLQEIVNARLQGLLDQTQAGLDRGDKAEAVLAAMGALAYSYEARELRLLAESIGASWTWDAEVEAANREALGPLVDLIAAVLSAGVKRGELAASADIGLLTHTIFSCDLQNFRLAVFAGWGPERLNALLTSQIALLMAAARP